MDLHQLAAADLATTLESNGQTVTLTDPSGVGAEFKAVSNDISLLIDPETGIPVSGRNVNIALRIASVRAGGFQLPKGIEDGATTPWLVSYTTVDGFPVTGKVIASNPDLSMGVITLRLELVR